MKNPFCIVWILLAVLGCWYAMTLGKQEKMDWSPCGSTNLTTTYRTHDGESMFHYFDDGKRVWRISSIKPSVYEETRPVVEMELVFERSPKTAPTGRWSMVSRSKG